MNIYMKIFITRRVPQIAVDILRKEGFEVVHNSEDRELSREELKSSIKDADGVISSLVDVIDEDVMASSGGRVKIFANFAVGYNNIDVECAKRMNIAVTNTPDVLSDTTAETAWALLFAVARRSVEADSYVRSGQWKSFRSDLMLGQDINNKTLGIVGMGRIGKRMAYKSKGFDMRVVYHNRSRDLEFEKEFGAEYLSLDDLLRQSDFVSLHSPLTHETEKMIGERELSLMKKNAILINTARGRVVDENALACALEDNRIYGAGLDVFENEPHVHEKLIGLKNVVMFPHIGSASVETRDTMARLCADNIISYLGTGKALTSVIG
jgi:glyoxylate reductase